jgi:hypothetical protein
LLLVVLVFRYLQPPSTWVTAALESRELLAVCLKKLKGLTKVGMHHTRYTIRALTRSLSSFKPKVHVTLSPAALRVKYKGLRVKNTIFQNLGVLIFLKQIFSSIFTFYLI